MSCLVTVFEDRICIFKLSLVTMEVSYRYKRMKMTFQKVEIVLVEDCEMTNFYVAPPPY